MSEHGELSGREAVVYDVVRGGRIGQPKQVARDVITALFHAGYLAVLDTPEDDAYWDRGWDHRPNRTRPSTGETP